MIKQPDTHTQPLPKGGVLDSNESDMYIPTSADKAVQSPSLGEGLGVGMGSRDCEGLKSLGSKTTCYRMDYAPDVLETFVNKHQGNDYWVRFNCPEFTSLCPITGQPDFAEIRISYIPDVKMVESKSLKLYLQEPEALPFQLPQPRRLPRRLREHNNERPHPPDGS